MRGTLRESERGESPPTLSEQASLVSTPQAGRGRKNPHRDKVCNRKFSAVAANTCMLATRSALPVSSVIADGTNPATPMHGGAGLRQAPISTKACADLAGPTGNRYGDAAGHSYLSRSCYSGWVELFAKPITSPKCNGWVSRSLSSGADSRDPLAAYPAPLGDGWKRPQNY